MVFGFGRKKRPKDADPAAAGHGKSTGGPNLPDDDAHGTRPGARGGDYAAAPDGSDPHPEGDSPGVIRQDGRPGSMGVIRAAGPAGQEAGDGRVAQHDVYDILDASDLARRQRTVSEVRDLRNSAAPLIDELIQMGRDLERDDLNVDSVDKHIAIIVVRGKKQVIDVIRRGVAQLPDVATADDAAKAESLLRKMLKKVGDVLGRQTRVIHIFAKKHANRLKDNLEVMNKQHAKMRDILDAHNRADAESQEIRLALGELEGLQKSRAKKMRRVAELSDAVRGLTSQESEASSAIDAIKSSADYKKYVELLDSAKECDVQMFGIRNETNSMFEKISRPLGRYEYGSSLDKDQQRILAGLVSDPASVMRPENVSVISEIISNVRRAVSSGSISVKDVEKTVGLLDDTANSVKPLATKASECSARGRDLLEMSRAAMPESLDECEERLSKSAAARKDNEERIASLRLEIKENDSAISGMVSDVQVRLCQHTGMRYEVESDAVHDDDDTAANAAAPAK